MLSIADLKDGAFRTISVKSRVYVRRWRYDEPTGQQEIDERKYFATKSVLHVFTTPQEALRVSDMSRYLGDRLDRQIKDLKVANKLAFKQYMESIVVGEQHKPVCDHEWDPITTNTVYQCCKKCGFVSYAEPAYSPWTGLAPD